MNYLKFTFLAFFFCLNFSIIQAQQAEFGLAVYYADYLHGRATALGETYNKNALTCAHKTYDLGTLLKVTRIDNGRSVIVRVNDRGPFNPGRVVDLSRAAAEEIDLITSGKTQVKVEKVGFSNINPAGGPSSYEQVSNENFTAKGVRTSNNNRNLEREILVLAEYAKGYFIQVASYSDYRNAARQYQEFQRKGVQDIYIKPLSTRGRGQLYKILTGPYLNLGDAQQKLPQLSRKLSVNGLVVRLDP